MGKEVIYTCDECGKTSDDNSYYELIFNWPNIRGNQYIYCSYDCFKKGMKKLDKNLSTYTDAGARPMPEEQDWI